MQGYLIRGHSQYTIDRRPDGSWGIRDYRPKGYGLFIPVGPKTGRVKLRNDEGKVLAGRTVDSWMKLSSVPRPGIPIPGHEDYHIDRRPDGSWGVRTFVPSKGAKYGWGGFLKPSVHRRDGREFYSVAPGVGQHVKHQIGWWVLFTLVGPPPFVGAQLCHRDDNHRNNEVENLYWGTAKQNAADREKNGLTPRGDTHGMSKVTDESAVSIYLAVVVGGRSQASVAAEFGVDQGTVSRVCRRTVRADATAVVASEHPFTPAVRRPKRAIS